MYTVREYTVSRVYCSKHQDHNGSFQSQHFLHSCTRKFTSNSYFLIKSSDLFSSQVKSSQVTGLLFLFLVKLPGVTVYKQVIHHAVLMLRIIHCHNNHIKNIIINVRLGITFICPKFYKQEVNNLYSYNLGLNPQLQSTQNVFLQKYSWAYKLLTRLGCIDF